MGSVQKQEASAEVLAAMNGLQTAGLVPKWGSAESGVMARRSVLVGELRQVGVKAPGTENSATRRPAKYSAEATGRGPSAVISVKVAVGRVSPTEMVIKRPFV